LLIISDSFLDKNNYQKSKDLVTIINTIVYV